MAIKFKLFFVVYVLEDGVECESFKVIYIESLLVYESRHYLQVHLDNSKIVSTQMIDYLDQNLFESNKKCCFTTESI